MSGRDLIGADASEILAVERRESVDRFRALDEFLNEAVHQMLTGQSVVEWQLHSGGRPSDIGYPWLATEQQAALGERYRPEAIRSRGGWFLPDKGKIRLGWVNFLRFVDDDPRFAISNATGISGNVELDSLESVLAWSLLSRIAEAMYAPFEIRGHRAGILEPSEVESRFADYSELCRQVGLDIDDALRPFLPGYGWSRLRAAEKIGARLSLREALRTGAGGDLGQRFRAMYVAGLVDRYYERASASGTALRRKVVTKPYAPDVVALFGGDWLEILLYLGEEPHPDEEIVRALPSVNLYVADRDKVESVAETTGTPTPEVEKIAAALFAGESADSPIEDRLQVMRQVWDEFDRAHRSQKSGMRPLPSIETSEFVAFHLVRDGYGREGLETELLSNVVAPSTMTRVQSLWGSAVFERWPERLYTEVLPFNQLAEAFGPALEFWHGVGLTAWYVAEGPGSRTTIAGMESYYSSLTDQLRDSGHPVDASLFTDLRKAEKKLGPPEQIVQDFGSTDIFSVQMVTGQRRDGFEHLRDVVTRHRQEWAAAHLDSYFTRWRSELHEVHTNYHRRIADTGRVPTVRQFSKMAHRAANHWLGGDLERLYAMIGETSPIDPTYKRLMPTNVDGFAEAVFKRLGGRPLSRIVLPEQAEEDKEIRPAVYRAADAARGAIRLIQCREAKGDDPTVAEFGTSRWRRFSELFDADEVGWSQFLALVDDVLSRSESALDRAPESAAGSSEHPSSPKGDGCGDEEISPRKGFLSRILGR